MAYRVRELPEAKREFARELDWLARYSKPAAERLLADYRSKIELIASGVLSQDTCAHPVLGKLGYRKALIGRGHLALYYIEGEELVIAHFFSQREDYANLV